LIVSGFLTSPKDQARICSGEAKPIRIASKLLTSSKFTLKLFFLWLKRSRGRAAPPYPGPSLGRAGQRRVAGRPAGRESVEAEKAKLTELGGPVALRVSDQKAQAVMIPCLAG
jgi:hypothetical protein